MKIKTMRARLLASSIIAGASVVALGATSAWAADSTSDVVTTASSDGGAVSAHAGAISTLTQATAAAPAEASTVGEIVVTGSRIPQPNLTSVSPIQAVGHQEFELEGHTDVIDLINNLPQNFQNGSSSGTDFSNTTNPLTGAGGISTIDLRGLGANRTLVLVNGRRLGIGDANTQNTSPAPDVDQVPTAMIDHIEVVTGGASAVYGSDAIAGVVNFILKHDFEGIQIDGTLGEDQHSQHSGTAQAAIRAGLASGTLGPLALPGDKWDGGNEDFSIIFGSNSPDAKGNVTAYFEYRNQEPVLMKDRDWSACLFKAKNAPGSGFCTGSANSDLFAPLSGPGCPTPGGSGTCTVKGNDFLPFPQTGTSPPAYFNSNNYEYLSRADERYIAGYEAHYDFSKELSVYSEFNFMNDRTTEVIAPSAAFAGGNPFDPAGAGGWDVNCGNPFLSASETTAFGCTSPTQLVDVFIGRRNIEGGGRISEYDHFNYRGVLGLRGDLGDAWHYDVYGSYYYTFLYQNNSNYLSNTRIGNALDVVIDPATGQPTCASVLSGADTKCVPWDIFQTGGVTSAALSYLNTAGSLSGSVTEQIVEGDFTGDLGKYGVKSPWADNGVGVSFGFDWRRDQLNFIPDQTTESGDLGGGSGAIPSIDKGVGVWEGYGEAQIPILEKQPLAELLQLHGGFRYSKYSTGPAPWTYMVGLEWEPVEDIRFRGSYQRAIRAPSVIELYDPVTITQSNNFGANGDPCAGITPVFTAAQCANTGVTAAQYGTLKQCPADQCDASAGGNTALKPETADTFSFGATFRPRWVRSLTVSVDWWDIHEYGFVGSLPENIVIDECANTGSSQFCSLIHRAPSTGFLFGPSDIATGGYVSGTGQNIAGGQETGIDIQGDYRLDLEDVGAKGVGSLSFALNGSYLLKESTALPGVGTYDCAGLFGSKCLLVSPTWRHTLRITWNTPWNVLASLQWRYIGGTQLDTNTSQPNLTNGKFNAFSPNIPGISYLDLAASWRVNSNFTVRGGVNNVLDQDPPLISSTITGTGTPNTYPTYDLLGREFFLSGTLKF